MAQLGSNRLQESRAQINNLGNVQRIPQTNNGLIGSERLNNSRENIEDISGFDANAILNSNGISLNRFSGFIKKAQRLLIFAKQREQIGLNSQDSIKDSSDKLKNDRQNLKDLGNLNKQKEPLLKKENYISRITIVNLEAPSNTIESVEIPTWPREVSFRPESQFVALTSIGRNNPHYNYVGSEDTLEFNVEWYATDNSRYKVLNSCRYLESLTKADGYKKRPPLLKIVWGRDDVVFKKHKWILVSAPYTMTEFQSHYKDNNGEVRSASNLPHQALQTLTFKRVVTNNIISTDIYLNDKSLTF